MLSGMGNIFKPDIVQACNNMHISTIISFEYTGLKKLKMVSKKAKFR